MIKYDEFTLKNNLKVIVHKDDSTPGNTSTLDLNLPFGTAFVSVTA